MIRNDRPQSFSNRSKWNNSNRDLSNALQFSYPRRKTIRNQQSSQHALAQEKEVEKSIDQEVLNSATEAILKIVHRGKGDLKKFSRDKDRDRIRDHVQRQMAPKNTEQVYWNYRNRILPESSQDNRSKLHARKIMNTVAKRSKAFSKTFVERNNSEEGKISTQFSFQPPVDITKPPNPTVQRQNSNSKRVSFESPQNKQKEKVPKILISPSTQSSSSQHHQFDLFSTPLRPTVELLQPPPLTSSKRRCFTEDSEHSNRKKPYKNGSGLEADINYARRVSNEKFLFKKESTRTSQRKIKDPCDIFGFGGN